MDVQARLSPYLPKCHIVGNHMSWLICKLRSFLGVQNLLISIFLGFSCIHCICINESTPPPPPTHTHTNTGHTCTSKCTRVWCSSHLRMRGSRFSLFSSAYFTEGPICFGPLCPSHTHTYGLLRRVSDQTAVVRRKMRAGPNF